MLEFELYNEPQESDPRACFATAAEIEFADRLRRELEQRYLARAVPSPTGSIVAGRKLPRSIP